MFLGTPLEEPFRVVVWLLIGIPLGLLLLMVASWFVTIKLTVVALMVGVMVAMVGYVVGIPWSIWFRLTKGRWPEY